MINSIYIAALKAGQEIAEYLGEEKLAIDYKETWERAAEIVDRTCFNGW